MMVYSSITLCVKHVVRFSSRLQRHSSNQIVNWISQSPLRTSQMPSLWAQSSSCSFVGYQAFHSSCFVSNASKQKRDFFSPFSCRSSKRGSAKILLGSSQGSHNMSLQISHPITTGPYWSKCKATSWLFVGLLCYASLESVHADSDKPESKDQSDCSPTSCYSHGKKVCTDYSVIGIPGDGRCLFRSVSHGACLRAGNPAPRESLQRELADELRARVADELVKRREETEWFIEGDFDRYVEQIRRPHVWGGEPELLLSSHVLQMPITVYMHDEESGGLIAIAEYGQEYGKDNPINVLYHGFGHYDALQIPARNSAPRSRI